MAPQPSLAQLAEENASSPHIQLEENDDYRLRITRTATGSLHEAIREEERRRVGKVKRKGSIFSKSRRGTGLFSATSLKRSGTTKTDSKHQSAFGALTATSALLAPAAVPRVNTSLGQEEQRANAAKFATPDRCKGKASDRDAESRRRRNIYVNHALQPDEVDYKGQPLARWARNKVRTSKYTLLSFLPKNLTEQFRRVANIYFLLLVVLQVFPIFGAAAPQIAMLPLVAVLGISAIKDGIEDYRRHILDNGVNNSPVTRLGRWRNVNQANSRPSLWSRLVGKAPARPKAISRGVKKLREKEGSFNADFLYSSSKPSEATLGEGETYERLDDVHSLGHSEADTTIDSLATVKRPRGLSRASSTNAPSYRTMGGSEGVVNYQRSTPGTATWERTLSKKLEVGDIILLKDGEQIPADVVVLATSDSDGCCFVETKSLDGETNLKPRRAVKATMSIQSEEDVEHSRFVVDAEPPHANLYAFNGVLRYPLKDASPVMASSRSPGGEPEPSSKPIKTAEEAVTINELLLRGCALRNTTWVIGLVVYTGSDTKIQLNQGETPSKRSKIDKESNYSVLANFVILVAICLACAIADGFFQAKDGTSSNSYEPGIELGGSPVVDAVVTFAACLILFQNIVPISLVITVELVKTIQALFIHLDIDMYYEPLDHPCVPRSWNLSDDLGQIEFIFSDKTGTLTQNVMELQRCSVQGVPYGEGLTEAMAGAAKRDGRDGSALDASRDASHIEAQKRTMISTLRRIFKHRFLREDQLTLISPQLADDLGPNRSSPQRQHIVDFYRAIALCHTALAERPEPTDQPDVIEYKAESPDEAALVSAARDLGFVFLSRSIQALEIEVMGQPERWQPLRVLEFNSTRKRMSVVVRAPDGKILLITKGADSVIYQRLASDHDEQLKTSTMTDLEAFANAGLRTLVIASRTISETEFQEWAATYDSACASTTDREDEIEKACELLEHELTILGATALEDKLQVGVPDAIEQLHDAGIKIWILTGDKLQTAIEIGFSCSLLKSDMDVLIISADTIDGTESQIRAGLGKIAADLASEASAGSHVVKQEHAVVIDGETLRHALSDTIKPLFLELSIQCETVICCRVSPAQKAQTVRLVKEGRDAMCLAIGDGANDVSMIQEAHIGVGIAGLEGAQASMSADYAIGQFRYLVKLLLVHGRWSYMRIGEMHANFFYKSCIWTFTMFWYQLYSSFNATYVYDYSLIMLFALVFTSLPVLVQGVFDQDVSARSALDYPQLYRRGIQGLYYTRTMFWWFMADGVYQSVVAFYLPYAIFAYSTSISPDGLAPSLQDFGTTIGIGSVLAANLFVGLNTHYWTWMVFVAVIGSSLTIWAWVAIYSAFPGLGFTGTAWNIYSTAQFWFTIIIVQATALGPRLFWKYWTVQYRPLDTDIVRERVHYGMEKMNDGPRDEEEKMSRNSPAPSQEKRSASVANSVYAQPVELEMTSTVALNPAGNQSPLESPALPHARATTVSTDAGDDEPTRPLTSASARLEEIADQEHEPDDEDMSQWGMAVSDDTHSSPGHQRSATRGSHRTFYSARQHSSMNGGFDASP